MREADRLAQSRAALVVACPWCGQPAGEACMTVQARPMVWPHEQRLAAAYTARRARSGE